jgi:hypothetical protein
MQQLFHAQRLAHADQLAEQFADVFTQGLVGGQQAVVGVELGVTGVIVTGAEVRVADDFASLTAQGIGVLSMRNKVNRLEELFMKLVERKPGAAVRP